MPVRSFLRRRQRGASLVELMIVLVLGLVITAGIYQLFSANQRAYRLQSALSEVQGNGRFVLDLMQRELRHAGFAPACQGAPMSGMASGGLALNMPESRADALFPDGRFEAVLGWDQPGNGSYGAGLQDYQEGDVLLIQHAAEPVGRALDDEIAPGDVEIPLAGDEGLPSGGLLAFVERGHCEIVETTSSGEVSNGFRNGFSGEATWVGKPQSDIYYIGQDESGNDALRRRDLIDDSVETLAAPVTDIELRFLEGESYVSVPFVDDWEDVTAVRVSVLLRSSEANVLESPASVRLGDLDFQAEDDDRHLYQGVTTTVALRNRLVEGE